MAGAATISTPRSTSRSTPLSRLIDSPVRRNRRTPLDAFDLARDKWHRGERIDIGKLASELGVGRATLFRWVGTREQLYGEVCWTSFQEALSRAQAAARGRGVNRLIDVFEKLLRSIGASARLRKFVDAEPEFALRVLTSRHSQVQRRCTLAIKELIDAHTDAGTMHPALPTGELAYVLVRITESFLYRDAITGAASDIESAIQAIRILLTAVPKRVVRRDGSTRSARS
jgi:AcrR family transcriptional regulator